MSYYDLEFDDYNPSPSYTFISSTKDCEDKHPFDDVSLLEPYLNQSKYWCDKTRTYIEIKNMEAAHALNAARLLLRRYADLIFAINLSGGYLESSEENIKSYPLFAALVKQAKGEAEKKFPWEKLKKK